MIERVCFIAPSTCLPRSANGILKKTVRLFQRGLGVREVGLSPHLFSSDEEIDHVTAPVEERAAFLKQAIRENDLVVSVAGGTGAEDLASKIDGKDYRVIRERRPLFIGFSDFTFLLSEIYLHTRVPQIYFPSLRLGKGNFKQLLALIHGEEVAYKGSRWLTTSPKRRFSGVPIGGNLSTFVNFLNRHDPPRFNWARHVLFLEDVDIDVEDLHRLLAALRRHRVLDRIKGIVVGSLSAYNRNHNYRKNQKDALDFIRSYARDVINSRRRQGAPLPILTVSNFGHNLARNLMAVPIGGRVTVYPSKKIVLRLPS